MMPSASPSIDYRTAPPSGRIRFESVEDGFTLFIPPMGMWRRSRWWLLVGLLLVPLPMVVVLAVIPAPLPQLLRNVAHMFAGAGVYDLPWLPLYPYPLLIEFYFLFVLLGGYLDGGRSTMIDVRRGQLSVRIIGRFHTTAWQCPLNELTPPTYPWLALVLSCRSPRKSIVLRGATLAELRWIWRVLTAARQGAAAAGTMPQA